MSNLHTEMVSMPPAGKWIWNNETNNLEFKPCISAGIKKKEKSPHQELVREHLVRISQYKSSAKGGSSGLRKRVGLAELNAYKAAAECSQTESITLEDIKQVAVSLMQENKALPMPRYFVTVIKRKEVDEFLAALLLYLHLFWQKKAQEEKFKPLAVKQIVTEQQMIAKASLKLELAKRHLAVCYFGLVLGQGFPEHHHMACSRRRVSSTSAWCLYECLYSFFDFVAWITFGWRDLESIQIETGRLFRLDAFNPALRSQRKKEEEKQEITQKESKTLPSIRKCQREPGVFYRCSPIMMSIMPFTRERVFQISSLHKQRGDKLIDTDVLMKELSQQLASCSFGILGKPLSQLRRSTPMPHGDRKEDEDVDDEDQVDDDESDNPLTSSRVGKTTFMNQRSTKMSAEKRGSLSRAHTVTSRATTEAPLSDTE